MEDLEYTQDFDEYALPDIPPPDFGNNLSDYEDNESVFEWGGNSNNDSSHTVHVDIPLYQVQKMNVNQLKCKLLKRKTLNGTKFFRSKTFNVFEIKVSTLFRWVLSDK